MKKLTLLFPISIYILVVVTNNSNKINFRVLFFQIENIFCNTYIAFASASKTKVSSKARKKRMHDKIVHPVENRRVVILHDCDEAQVAEEQARNRGKHLFNTWQNGTIGGNTTEE